MTYVYVLTNMELLFFCTANTVIGCVMTIFGIRLSANKKVREKVIEMYHRVRA